jgi:hypothetical protein
MTHSQLIRCLLAFASITFLGFANSADLPEPEFTIRERNAHTGSNIRKDLLWGSSIPINRTYGQLTPEQKAVVHALYERIEPGDEPPFPVDGLKPILEAIRKGQSKLLVTGTLTLAADVDSSGDVTKVEVYDNPDPILTKFAASVLMITKFKPAICKGVPCRMQYPFSFVMRVQ